MFNIIWCTRHLYFTPPYSSHLFNRPFIWDTLIFVSLNCKQKFLLHFHLRNFSRCLKSPMKFETDSAGGNWTDSNELSTSDSSLFQIAQVQFLAFLQFHSNQLLCAHLSVSCGEQFWFNFNKRVNAHEKPKNRRRNSDNQNGRRDAPIKTKMLERRQVRQNFQLGWMQPEATGKLKFLLINWIFPFCISFFSINLKSPLLLLLLALTFLRQLISQSGQFARFSQIRCPSKWLQESREFRGTVATISIRSGGREEFQAARFSAVPPKQFQIDPSNCPNQEFPVCPGTWATGKCRRDIWIKSTGFHNSRLTAPPM